MVSRTTFLFVCPNNFFPLLVSSVEFHDLCSELRSPQIINLKFIDSPMRISNRPLREVYQDFDTRPSTYILIAVACSDFSIRIYARGC